MLDDLTKSRIRWHLGITFAGTPLSSDTLGLRTVTRAGQLEYYMNVLQPSEEAILLGRPYAAMQLGYPLVPGQTVTFTMNAHTVTYVIIPSDLLAPSPLFQILSELAQLINNYVPYGVQAVPGQLQNDQVAPGQYPPFGQIYIVSTATFTCTFGGTANVSQTANGTIIPPPQLVTFDQNQGNSLIVNGLLPICDQLETSLMSVDQRLAFTQAGAASTGEVNFNPREMRQRLALYAYYVRKMAALLSFTVTNYPLQGRSSGWGLNQ